MGDGEPPPKQPPEGGGDAGNGSANPSGTPVALNDAAMSQASKEIQMSFGADLESFLQATNRGGERNPDKDNIFAAHLLLAPRAGRPKRTKGRFTPAPYESQDQQADENDKTHVPLETTDKEKDTETNSAGTTPAEENNQPDKNQDSDQVNLTSSGEGGNKEPATEAPTEKERGDAGEQQKANGRRQRARKPRTTTKSTEPNNEPASEATEPKKTAKENPWTKAREVLLRQKVNTKAARIEYKDIKIYKKYYALAKATHYRVIPDNYPRRPITEDETMTMYLWRAKKIHLDTPPRFIVETHTLREDKT